MQEDGLFLTYVDKVLCLLNDPEKSVQKSALSNFQLLLQNEQTTKRLVKKLGVITKVRLILV